MSKEAPLAAPFYDIVIVGGGLVGAVLAKGLAALPLRIAVIEAKTAQPANLTVTDNRTLALARTSCQILDRLGLWQALKPYATPIQQIHVSEMNSFGILRMHAAQQHLPAFGYAIAAEKLTSFIQTQAMHANKVEWLAPAHLKNLYRSEIGYTLELETASGLQTCQTSLLVAADGANSHTRQLLNISVQTHDYQQQAITAHITLSRDHNYIAYERFSSSGPLGLLPGEPKQCALAWVVTPEEAKHLTAMSETAFCQKLQSIFGYRIGKILHADQRHTYALHSLHAKEQVLPHAILLGNAAHTLHPVAAQGFNLSLRDVSALLETLQFALAEQKNVGDLTILQKYLACRKTEQNLLRLATHSLVYAFSTDFLPMRLSRNLAMFGLNFLPQVCKMIACYGMGHL